MVKSTNYLRLVNVICANWIQRRSISNGSHLKQVWKPKRKEIVTNYEHPQTINIPVLVGTSRYYGTDEEVPPQADIVFLEYVPSGATMFYNEVNVIESHAHTSFWACCVYFGSSVFFGIEENDNNEKFATLAIVRSPRSDQMANDDDDIKTLEKNLRLQSRKVKSESSPYTSIPFEWNAGDPISLIVAFIHESDEQYSCVANIYNNNSKKWENVGKFSSKNGIHVSKMDSCKSMIIDTKTGAANEARSASFNPWMKDDKGKWFQPEDAVFYHTGTTNKVNAWTHLGHFFMRTGGDTERKVFRGQAIHRRVSRKVPSIVKQISDELESKQKK